MSFSTVLIKRKMSVRNKLSVAIMFNSVKPKEINRSVTMTRIPLFALILLTVDYHCLPRYFYAPTSVNVSGFKCVNKIRDNMLAGCAEVKPRTPLIFFYIYVSGNYVFLILFKYVKPVAITPLST